MKRKLKLIKRSLLLIATILMVITITACSSNSGGAETYTQELDFDEFADNSTSSGFLSAIGTPDTSKQINTLILNEDNTYSLTKNISITDKDDEEDIILKYIFTGNYTEKGTTVTLDAAENVEYSEEWGPSLVDAGYQENISGNDEERLAYFPSRFLVESNEGNADVTVEVNSENNTFKYIEVNE